MKNSPKKKWKRILSMMLTVALVLGLCQTTAMVEAADKYSGSLHLKGAQTGSGANYMYLLGTDEVLCGENPHQDWDVRLTPADDESGVYVNEERLTGGYKLIKYFFLLS